MEIIQKLPEELVKYITEFLPTNYELNLHTYSYTYIHRDYPLIIKLTLNPYVYLKYRKTHSVKLIKPGGFRSVFVVMSFNVNYYDIALLADMEQGWNTPEKIRISVKKAIENSISGSVIQFANCVSIWTDR